MNRLALFVYFLLSFLILSPATVSAEVHYVGSEKCMSCHKGIYELSRDTLHSKSQQPVTSAHDRVVVDWRGTLKLKAGKLPELTIKLSESPDKIRRVILVDAKDLSKEVTYPIVRTYGGWGRKQRYQVKIGNNHFILPIQWNQLTSRWVPYNVQNWYNEDGSLKPPAENKSFEMNCSGCHNTGLEWTHAGKGYEFKYMELNTGCEKCHGPGSKHIKAPQSKGTIVHPRKLGYERGIEVCGQCHSRGVSVPKGTFDFPWNDKENKPYKLGEPLSDYYQVRPGVWGDGQAHDKQHHQQWDDLGKSPHHKWKVACYDCHHPHGGPGPLQLTKADYNNNLCLSCHGFPGMTPNFSNPEGIRMHTKHTYAPETKGTSRCSFCHMVKTVSSAEAGDIHAHDLKIIKPHLSLEVFEKDLKTVLPNSCNGCHKEWGGDRAALEKGVRAYESLFGK